METTFRQSMNWLHTWAGVVLGSVLFAVFWMGTLSVFDKEIDRWMAPATRLAMPSGEISLDAQRTTYGEAAAVNAPTWNIFMPNDRLPVVRTGWRGTAGVVSRYNDPATGKELPDPGTLAGSGFLYPFHYHLHLHLMNLGFWLVGAAGMAMLVLCVSGVIIHRKIFADFFTFRPQRNLRRAVLDLHNVAGVLGLPFHLVITLSGLVIFFNLYFPSGWIAAYGPANLRVFTQETYGAFSRPRSNKPGPPLASLDAMAAEVHKLWPQDEIASVTVYYPGNAAAFVQINTSTVEQVTSLPKAAFFDAGTGTLLFRQAELAPAMTTFRFLYGVHAVQFHHWTLRWLYFVLGIAGCALIGTGFLFWLASRRQRHAALGLSGVRVVEALATGSTTGLITATLAFFVVNRLLPLGLGGRPAIEIETFYAVWVVSFIHAGLRPGRKGWREQSVAIAGLAILAVLLNAATTGDNILRTLGHRYLWPVAGMDLMLLFGASVAGVAALKLRGALEPENVRPAGEEQRA